MSQRSLASTLVTALLVALCGFAGGAVGGWWVARQVKPVQTIRPTNPVAPSQPRQAAPVVPGSGSDLGTGSDIVAAVKRVGSAVVNIDTFGQTQAALGGPWDELFGQKQSGQPQLRGSGSGFIISAAKGLVMTNQHVIEGAEKIEVTLDDRAFEATRVGADKMSDIALLKIEPKDLPEAPIGDGKALEQGEWVIAIGNPFRDFPHTVTVGVVSALNRQMPVGDRQYNNLIQTDAAINMGNSGGPLCNLSGEVVGVNSAIFSPTQTYAGIGFAIVIDDAMVIAEHLLNDQGVPYLGIGMKDLTPEIAKDQGLSVTSGVLITDVYDGPAADAGIQSRDLLATFNGVQVLKADDVPNLVLHTKVGQKVPIEVIRAGQKQKLTLTVGARKTP